MATMGFEVGCGFQVSDAGRVRGETEGAKPSVRAARGNRRQQPRWSSQVKSVPKKLGRSTVSRWNSRTLSPDLASLALMPSHFFEQRWGSILQDHVAWSGMLSSLDAAEVDVSDLFAKGIDGGKVNFPIDFEKIRRLSTPDQKCIECRRDDASVLNARRPLS